MNTASVVGVGCRNFRYSPEFMHFISLSLSWRYDDALSWQRRF